MYESTVSLKYEKTTKRSCWVHAIMLGSCMYASWHVDSREVDVAVTASNRRVMRWCGYGMLWRWLLLQLQALQNIIKPTKHKVVGNY